MYSKSRVHPSARSESEGDAGHPYSDACLSPGFFIVLGLSCLACLPSESQGSSCFCLPTTGLHTCTAKPRLSCGCLRLNSGPHNWGSKHFTHHAVSLDLFCLIARSLPGMVQPAVMYLFCRSATAAFRLKS